PPPSWRSGGGDRAAESLRPCTDRLLPHREESPGGNARRGSLKRSEQARKDQAERRVFRFFGAFSSSPAPSGPVFPAAAPEAALAALPGDLAAAGPWRSRLAASTLARSAAMRSTAGP